MEDSKRFQVSFVFLSIGYILLGLFRLLVDDPQAIIVTYILGAILILTGIVRIAIFFLKDNIKRVFGNDLAIGVLMLIGGVYALVQPGDIAKILFLILGLCVIYDSILKLQYSFELNRTQFRFWWVLLIISILTTIMGILLIVGRFSEETTRYLFGGVLVFDGIINLLSLILLKFRMRGAEKRKQKALKAEKKAPKNQPQPEEVEDTSPLTPPVISNNTADPESAEDSNQESDQD